MVRDAPESTIHLSSQLSTLSAVSDETMTWLSGSEAMATRRICIVSPSLSSEAASEFAFATLAELGRAFVCRNASSAWELCRILI